MTKKRKENTPKVEKEEIIEEEKDWHMFAVSILIRIFRILLWWFSRVAIASIIALIMYVSYFFMKHTIIPTELPKYDKDRYWGNYPDDLNQDTSIKPFKIEFSDEMIKDLKLRLHRQRPCPPPVNDTEFVYGFNSNYLTEVVNFWKNKYDFKVREKFLNKYNHYKTNIQGLDIHYMHVQPVVPPRVKVYTIVLLHGWPSSIREFYEIIPKLTTPNSKYKFVFEIVAPSLPGFIFSEGPLRAGMHPTEMALVVSNLMERIGRKTYYVHGGELGHSVGSAMATIFPINILGFHTTSPKMYHPMAIFRSVIRFLFPGLTYDPEMPEAPRLVRPYLRRAFHETGYLHMQATKPDTIGISLTDSPAGLAAYIIEKFVVLTTAEKDKVTDNANLRNNYSLTQLVDNVMLYWITNSIMTSMRAHAAFYDSSNFNLDLVVTDVPTWGFKYIDYLAAAAPSSLRRKYRNYLHTTVVDDGGICAALEHPGVLAMDIFAAVDIFIGFHAKNNAPLEEAPTTSEKTIYDYTVTDIHGKEVQLKKYKGYVLLIVNVASECGLTERNYEQLTELYKKYEEKGLRILAFPCNQFGFQEPGTAEDIINFTTNRGVKFDVFSKIQVNGNDAHPLWKFLKKNQSGTVEDWIKWNFSKFIVDRNGVPVGRFGPEHNPLDLESDLIKYIETGVGSGKEEL